MKGLDRAYAGVLGGKTGYTQAAGNTLVTYAKGNKTYLVAVVLQSVNGAYSDTKALLDYGFNNFTRVKVSKNQNLVSTRQLPSEKNIIKTSDDSCLFKSDRYRVSVTLPNGADTSILTTANKITKNPAGLPLLTTTYSYNGYPVGTARYVQQQLLSDMLF